MITFYPPIVPLNTNTIQISAYGTVGDWTGNTTFSSSGIVGVSIAGYQFKSSTAALITFQTASFLGTLHVSNNADSETGQLQVGGSVQYATETDIRTRWGDTSVLQWATLDGNPASTGPRIQEALNQAQNDINMRFLDISYYSVNSGGTIANGPFANAKCRQWTVDLAGAWLYTTRGLRDEKVYTSMIELRRQTYTEISQETINRGYDASPKWPVSSGGPFGWNANEFWTPNPYRSL